MKAFHFLFSALLVSPFFLSTQLTATQPLNEQTELEFSQISEETLQRSKLTSRSTVFASFRSNQSQSLLGGQSVLFNIEEANQGKGIVYHPESGEFRIRKEGFYHVNYGVFHSNLNFSSGVHLIHTRDGVSRIRHSSLISDSPSLIFHLKKNDKIRIAAQNPLRLARGSVSTAATDTAVISFMRLRG